MVHFGQHRLGGDGGRPAQQEMTMSNDWPLFEVFIRSRAGLEHKHVGSVHATDARMAIEHARDVYTRRQEGVSIWVVRSSDIMASDPADADALFEPARDKVYRHPTFYAIPDEVKNL
jgi:ring-1,2-phenylacetyl-CoA epoxidase subunit PaaB